MVSRHGLVVNTLSVLYGTKTGFVDASSFYLLEYVNVLIYNWPLQRFSAGTVDFTLRLSAGTVDKKKHV